MVIEQERRKERVTMKILSKCKKGDENWREMLESKKN